MSAAAIAGAIAAVGSGGLSIMGTREQNIANAREAMHQRDWEERMSNTAYQRKVKDLRRAGLNPMLALGGGASSPPGARAHMENVMGGVPAATAAGASTAVQLRAAQKDIEVKDAQIANINADTALKAEQTYSTGAQGDLTGHKSTLAYLDIQHLYKRRRALLDEQIKLAKWQAHSAKDVNRKKAAQARLDLKLIKLDALLKRAGGASRVVPRGLNYQRYLKRGR